VSYFFCTPCANNPMRVDPCDSCVCSFAELEYFWGGVAHRYSELASHPNISWNQPRVVCGRVCERVDWWITLIRRTDGRKGSRLLVRARKKTIIHRNASAQICMRMYSFAASCVLLLALHTEIGGPGRRRENGQVVCANHLLGFPRGNRRSKGVSFLPAAR